MREAWVGADTGSVVLLRWSLILGTSYLLLFDGSPDRSLPLVALFIAAYLASNLLAIVVLRHGSRPRLVELGFALIDPVAIALALALREGASIDFFVAYFLVILIAAATDRLGIVALCAIGLGGLELFWEARLLGGEASLTAGQLLRVPFLLTVSIFFGHLMQRVRATERFASAAREDERTRSEFLSGVVHDLKNPLSVIQGFAEVLLAPESTPLTEDQADSVRRIHANAQHATRLSLNLLNTVRIRSGELVLDRRRARLGDVVEELLPMISSAADLRGVTLRFVRHEQPIPDVAVDAVQLQRALWNVIDHAIRDSPSGRSVVVAVEPGGESAVIRVTDEGRGIAADDLPRLFERYARTRRGQITVAGLGLFVAKTIVEAHGGRIEVRSAVPGGTTFRIHLPGLPTQATAPIPVDGEPPSALSA